MKLMPTISTLCLTIVILFVPFKVHADIFEKVLEDILPLKETNVNSIKKSFRNYENESVILIIDQIISSKDSIDVVNILANVVYPTMVKKFESNIQDYNNIDSRIRRNNLDKEIQYLLRTNWGPSSFERSKSLIANRTARFFHREYLEHPDLLTKSNPQQAAFYNDLRKAAFFGESARNETSEKAIYLILLALTLTIINIIILVTSQTKYSIMARKSNPKKVGGDISIENNSASDSNNFHQKLDDLSSRISELDERLSKALAEGEKVQNQFIVKSTFDAELLKIRKNVLQEVKKELLTNLDNENKVKNDTDLIKTKLEELENKLHKALQEGERAQNQYILKSAFDSELQKVWENILGDVKLEKEGELLKQQNEASNNLELMQKKVENLEQQLKEKEQSQSDFITKDELNSLLQKLRKEVNEEIIVSHEGIESHQNQTEILNEKGIVSALEALIENKPDLLKWFFFKMSKILKPQFEIENTSNFERRNFENDVVKPQTKISQDYITKEVIHDKNIIYAGVPQGDYFFKLFPQLMPQLTYYQILPPSGNSEEGEFTLVKDEDSLKAAFNVIDTSLRSACDLIGIGKPSIDTIIVTPGKVKKEGEKWKIIKKAILKW